MRALVQRVGAAQVTVAGATVGAIAGGLLVYLGCQRGDGPEQARRMAARLGKLRVFEDADGKTNLDLRQAGGAVLLVSQFTLAADTRQGNRPGFSGALAPAEARELVDLCRQLLAEQGFEVESGQFGATMEVSSVNLGPATYLLEEAPPQPPA